MDFQKNVIMQITQFIENNIESDLSIPTLALLSGYSMWHLQRLFYETTGVKVGTYVRRRKLTRSAHYLKRTNMPIYSIALLSGFGTQQGYTRAFSALFKDTPYSFRTKSFWDFANHAPPFTFGCNINYRYVYLTNFEVRVTQKPFQYGIDSFGHGLLEIKSNIKRTGMTDDSSDIYIESLGERRFENRAYLKYFIPKPDTLGNNMKSYISQDTTKIKNGGKYIEFIHRGSNEDLGEFIDSIYNIHLANFKIKIRDNPIIVRNLLRNIGSVSLYIPIL